MRIFEELESEVRGYLRSFPAIFDTAQGSLLFDEQGKRYVDFFSGAGTLNYGHNNPRITNALIEYLQRNGIVHGLDKATVAKRQCLEALRDTILAPRHLGYKVQFAGPTGTNAVETALKLAHGEAPFEHHQLHERLSRDDAGFAGCHRELFLPR